VVILTFAVLMYEINQDYKNKKSGQDWHIMFMKHYYDDSINAECEHLFRQTGYWPKYCKD